MGDPIDPEDAVDLHERNPEIELHLLPRSSPTDLVAEEIDVAIRTDQIPIDVVYTQRPRLPLRIRAFVDFVVTSLTTPAWRDSALLASEP